MTEAPRVLQPPAICWRIVGRFSFLQVVWAPPTATGFDPTRSTSMRDEGFLVRTGILRGFEEACGARGVDAAELVAELGLPPQVLEDGDLYIHREKSAALLSLAAERGDCPSFGLELAQRQDQGVLGALAHLIFRASTVGEALDLARQYLTYHLRGADLTVRNLDETWCVVEAELGLDVTPGTRPSADLTVVHVAKILARLCGEHYEVREVWMTHPAPDDPTPYHGFFDAPILWERAVLGVVLPRTVLELPPSSVPDIKAFLLQYVETVSAPLDPDNLGAQTRAVLRSMVGRSAATAEVVAAAMSMHVRELQRELRALGLSFRELRDDAYREYACAALRQPDTTVTELALTLDYSDGSAFSRAFKKWTGKSPTAWRREALEGVR